MTEHWENGDYYENEVDEEDMNYELIEEEYFD